MQRQSVSLHEGQALDPGEARAVPALSPPFPVCPGNQRCRLGSLVARVLGSLVTADSGSLVAADLGSLVTADSGSLVVQTELSVPCRPRAGACWRREDRGLWRVLFLDLSTCKHPCSLALHQVAHLVTVPGWRSAQRAGFSIPCPRGSVLAFPAWTLGERGVDILHFVDGIRGFRSNG